jgi:hypothetical protein
MNIQVTPLTGSVGALIEGIDLNQPLSPSRARYCARPCWTTA